jgi:archaellum component FlaC
MDRYESYQLESMNQELAGMAARVELLEEIRRELATNTRTNHEERIQQLEAEVETLTATVKQLLKTVRVAILPAIEELSVGGGIDG